MKKSILKIGKPLNKAEQKKVKGGDLPIYACDCNYATGAWSNPNCGSHDCREQEVEPLDLCDLYPNTPGC